MSGQFSGQLSGRYLFLLNWAPERHLGRARPLRAEGHPPGGAGGQRGGQRGRGRHRRPHRDQDGLGGQEAEDVQGQQALRLRHPRQGGNSIEEKSCVM